MIMIERVPNLEKHEHNIKKSETESKKYIHSKH